MAPLFRKFLGLNWLLFALMVAIIGAGVYGVYAAVHFREGSEAYLASYWSLQMKMALFGLVPFFAAALMDYRWIRWGAIIVYITGIVLMLLLSTALGVEVYKQKIALNIGGIQFQPAQIAITGSLMLLAVVLGEGHKFIPWLRHYLIRFAVSGAVMAVPFLLMVKQGDLGSAMVIAPLALGMMIVGNIPFRCLIAAILVGLTVLPPVYFFFLQDYQRSRIQVVVDLFMGKEVDEKGEAWANIHTLTAVGSSGWEGKGTDATKLVAPQKNMTQLNKIPKITSHNDFVFAVFCEALGFRGAAVLVGAFLFMLLLSLTVAFFARDALGRLLATGIVALLFGHIFEHIGMNIGLLPITGIPLPLVSYGGTFLLVCMGLLGLLQSVWIHRNTMLEEADPRRTTGKSPAFSR